MATNRLGKGTANVAVNLLDEEKMILGRLAVADDRSLGEFIRRMVIVGLRTSNPSAATELETIRRKRNEQLLLSLK